MNDLAIFLCKQYEEPTEMTIWSCISRQKQIRESAHPEELPKSLQMCADCAQGKTIQKEINATMKTEISIPEHKQCIRCQKTKPIDEFPKNKYTCKDGHENTCKVCKVALGRQRRQEKLNGTYKPKRGYVKTPASVPIPNKRAKLKVVEKPALKKCDSCPVLTQILVDLFPAENEMTALFMKRTIRQKYGISI